MPLPLSSYESFGRGAGGLAGGAAGATGGGLLDMLGNILSPLDYPRQALWNIPRSLERFTDSGDVTDLAGLLPAAGAVAGGLMGGPLGAALGAGLTQGAGHLTDQFTGRQRFDAPTGEDALRAIGGDPDEEGGTIKSMLLQAVGDPLTFLGGGLGGVKGAAKGAEYAGGRLANIARTIGPEYAGENALREAITEGILNAHGSHQISALAALEESPLLSAIAKEVEPGSQFLGSGLESLALQRPGGGVTLVRRHVPLFNEGGFVPDPRPVGESIVPAARSVQFDPSAAMSPTEKRLAEQAIRDNPVANSGGGYRVEHTPFSPDVSGAMPTMAEGYTGNVDRLRKAFPEYRDLEAALAAVGETPTDLHGANIGWGPGGKMLVRDPGAIQRAAEDVGLPRVEQFTPTKGTAPENLLLKLLGSRTAIRNEIESGTRPFGVPMRTNPLSVTEWSPVEQRLQSLLAAFGR